MQHLIESYGYGAVFVLVALEAMGAPLPGESALIAASIYAGTTHKLNPYLIVLAAAAGAIIGDNAGYWIGRELGFRLLVRFGRHIGLEESKLKLGQYLFIRHGAKIVFFGRFVAVLRTFAALLAGANRMDWRRFMLWNAAGGSVWAALYGMGGFLLGKEVERVSGPLRWTAIGLGILAVIGSAIFLRRNFKRLEEAAVRALPGPLRLAPRLGR